MISRPRTPVADYRAMRVTVRSRGVEVGVFVGVDLATMNRAHLRCVPVPGVRQRAECRSVSMAAQVRHLPLGEA